MALVEQFHAKTLKGLEALLAEELKGLGAERIRAVNRGVDFYGSRSLMYKVNLASRLSLRVLLPIMSFEAVDTDFLYRKIKRFDWGDYLDPKKTFAVDSVVYSPHFSNSQFAAFRVKDAIADHFMEKLHLRPSVNKEQPDVLINLHISDRQVTLSLDSSGGSLHKRGYRRGNFEAPLNEVLAAGMIMSTGWKGETPFLDPMCGSGTLAIEAALIAAGIPPGIFRDHFGFENWNDFDGELMGHVARSLPVENEVQHPIFARDIDPEAVDLTRMQLGEMELTRLVSVEQQDFEASEEMEGLTIIMNPPYGERLHTEDPEAFYAMIGTTLKHRFPGSDAWILSSNAGAMKRVGLKPSSRRKLNNGSLECSYNNYRTFKGKLKEQKK